MMTPLETQPSLSVQLGLEGRPLLTLPAAAHRHPLPLLTTHHPLPTVFLSVLYFHILTNPLAGNPFIFTSIQTPGSVLSVGLSAPTSVPPVLRSFFNSFVLKWLQPLSLSLPSFLHPFLCFQPVTASFSKYPGCGYPGRFCGVGVDATPHYLQPTTHFLLLIQPPAWKKQVRGYQCGFWTIRSARPVPVGVFRGVPIPAPLKNRDRQMAPSTL